MKSKKGVVVSQAVVIIFTVIIATVIIVIATRGIGLFSNTGKEYQNTKLIQAFNKEFDSIKKLGYGSKIKVEIPSYGAYIVCFVDLDKINSDSADSLDLPSEIQDFVTAEGQDADIYIFGDKIDMIDVGNISVSSENQLYLCINSTNYFRFYLTNNGTSISVSGT
ncbi:MAG: hypothetical protein PWQ87_295 [Candidatus Woesearchaeota archaeon]|nr:hypothetical protein [Candidatus Woesearchaeota archaeon]